MTEEERATLYREEFIARRQARREQFLALVGDRESREDLDAAWRPILIAQIEGQMPLSDDCFDALEEMYVEVPQRDIFVTEAPGDFFA